MKKQYCSFLIASVAIVLLTIDVVHFFERHDPQTDLMLAEIARSTSEFLTMFKESVHEYFGAIKHNIQGLQH